MQCLFPELLHFIMYPIHKQTDSTWLSWIFTAVKANMMHLHVKTNTDIFMLYYQQMHNSFRGLASDSNKTGKRNSNSVTVSNWNILHLSHLLTRRVQKPFYIFPEHTTLTGFFFYGDLINPSVSCFHHLSKLCCKSYLAKYCSALFHL